MAAQHGRRGWKSLIFGFLAMAVLAPGLAVGIWLVGWKFAEIDLSDVETVQPGETYNVTSTSEELFILVRMDEQGATDSSSTGTSSPPSHPDAGKCTVIGPDGAEVKTTGSLFGGSVESDGAAQWHEQRSFRPTQTGEHRIECGAPVKILGDGGASGNFWQQGATFLIGLIVGALVGLAGLIFTILGIVQLCTGPKQRPAGPPMGQTWQ